MLSRWFGSFREVPWRCAVLSSRGGVFSRNVHEQVCAVIMDSLHPPPLQTKLAKCLHHP